MANQYSWQIAQLECYPEHEGHTDVVFTCHWRRQATDGTHTADIYGSQAVTLDPDAPFTPYANLTEAQVIGWLEAAFGDELLEAQQKALDKQIEDQINPPVIRPQLPWLTVVAPPAPDLSEPSN
jgi:hypothetical protein